ncbi:MAG: hypothetical protein D6702_02975 [Planctomycetota bacterium]|nr:MAG: hypothetical protein D6702_02975 [Planctomycetota bacterium]
MRSPASLLLPLLLAAPAVAQDPAPAQEPVLLPWNTRNRVADPTPVRFRLDFQETTIGASEDLGLLGLHVDFLEPFQTWPGIYLGAGGFTAVTGNRGGFLAGGLEGGLRFAASDTLSFDAGLFAGVGKGRSVPTGDGLVLRQHFGAQYQLDNDLGLRLEVSNIDFPTGNGGDVQLSAGLAWMMRPWVARNELRDRRAYPATETSMLERMRFGAGVTGLLVDSGSRRTNGAAFGEDIALPFARADLFVDPNLFLTFSGGGVPQGESKGYAQVLAGVGYVLPLTDPRFAFEGTLQFGGGGGGGVQTGGGLLMQPAIAARIGLAPQVSAGLTLSRLMALDGDADFDATGIGVNLAFTTGLPDYRPATRGVLLPDQTPLSLWGLEVVHRTYIVDSGVRLDNGRLMPDTFNTMGAGLAFPLTPEMEVTAQAFGGYDGLPGGYAEGWLGARYRHLFAGHPSAPQYQVVLSGALGGAGGGGINNGDGAMWDLRGGLGFILSPTIGLDLSLGRTAAVDGLFEAWSFQFGLNWHFGLPIAQG